MCDSGIHVWFKKDGTNREATGVTRADKKRLDELRVEIVVKETSEELTEMVGHNG